MGLNELFIERDIKEKLQNIQCLEYIDNDTLNIYRNDEIDYEIDRLLKD